MEKQKVETALSVAKNLKIQDEQTYEQAKLFKETLNQLQKEIDDTFDPPIAAAHASHQAALAAKKPFQESLAAAAAILKKAIAAYEQSLRVKAEEERRLAESMGAADLLPTLAPLPKMATYMRKDYYAKVVDKRAFVEAALAGEVDFELVLVNQSALDALATSAHELFKVPGCELEIREVACSKPGM